MGYEWRHALETRAEDFGDFEKSQLSWELDTERESGLSELAEARQICALRALHEMGADGKARIERMWNVYLSPYVEEPLTQM